MLIYFLLMLITLLVLKIAQAKTSAHVLLLRAAESLQLDRTSTLLAYWGQSIKRKSALASYPVNIIYEKIHLDATVSNLTHYRSQVIGRLLSRDLPPVAMIGCLFVQDLPIVAGYAAFLNIPIITLGVPFSNSLSLPYWLPTTFSMTPPPAATSETLVNALLDRGARSIVTVAILDIRIGTTNEDLCYGSAYYAASRGITVLGTYNFTRSLLTNDIQASLIRELRDKIKPDILVWCDFYSGIEPAGKDLNIFPILKRENYVPKALCTFGILDSFVMDDFMSQGLLLYSTSLELYSPRLSGRDYTQEDAPFANMFRPNRSDSIVDKLNEGISADRPSSNQIFTDWFISTHGYYPTLHSAIYWTHLDLIESVLYKAAVYNNASINPFLTGVDILTILQGAQLTGITGKLIFNVNRINDAAKSFLLQAQAKSGLSEIVAPVNVRTSNLIYPMPTWDERVYAWNILKSNYELSTTIASSGCAFLVLSLACTAIVRRKEPNIKMLDFSHIVLLCLLAATACLALALIWQADVNQAQCSSILWLVYLPISAIVHLVNNKALRLSHYLKPKELRHNRPYTHLKVLDFTSRGVFVSVVVFLIVSLADPPKITRIVLDAHRPMYDYHECSIGTAGSSLLYLLFVAHLIATVACVSSVRNGSEAFYDGVLMKESMIIIYLSISFAFLISLLGVEYRALYLTRTIIVNIGILVFCFRLLAERCAVHWIPGSVKSLFNQVLCIPFQALKAKIFPEYSPDFYQGSIVDNADQDFDAPAPSDDKLDALLTVFQDSERLEVLSTVAKDSQIYENVEFISDVILYKEQNAKYITESSIALSGNAHIRASQLFDKYGRVGAESEINISDAQKVALEKHIKEWKDQEAIISLGVSRSTLLKDDHKRQNLFDHALKEITTMLYQNIWEKFRAKESEKQMANDASYFPFSTKELTKKRM